MDRGEKNNIKNLEKTFKERTQQVLPAPKCHAGGPSLQTALNLHCLKFATAGYFAPVRRHHSVHLNDFKEAFLSFKCWVFMSAFTCILTTSLTLPLSENIKCFCLLQPS